MDKTGENLFMKTAHLEWDGQKVIYDIYKCVNLLEGVRPIIEDENGNRDLLLQTLCKDAPGCYTMLTDNQDTDKHIDIFSRTAKLTYDMGQQFAVDKIGILGYYFGPDYGLADFEIFLSDEMETLYESENCVLAHDNTIKDKSNDDYYRGDYSGADFYITLSGHKGRFFGLKINKANPTDDIIRLSCLSIYSDEITKQRGFIKKYIDKILLCQPNNLI